MTDQIQKRPEENSDKLSGTYSDSRAVNDRMRWAQENAHLVSPATAAGAIPDGCGIAMCMVLVDATDTYKTDGGKLALSKTALQKIGHAAGISWDPRESGRLDDGSNPHYCRWRAVGTYRAFDGQIQKIVAEKEMDLRNGSTQIAGKTEAALKQMRQHLQAHAETKAQLRAIRSLGVKTSYSAEELQKPFVCARIMFTGRSRDPEMQREFSRMTAEAFLGGTRTLYANPALPAEPLESNAARLPPPPVGSVPASDDDFGSGEQPAARAEPDAGAARRESATDAAPKAAPARTQVVHAIPGGKAKGTPLEKATTKDLEYWVDRIGGDIEAGNCRDAERDGALHDAMRAELASRNGGQF